MLELSSDPKTQRTFQFEAGPVIVICPTAPAEEQGPLADEQDPNFTKMQQYGDLDALIELYGHLRAENPTLDVFHRLTSDVVSDDFSSHVVLLGGVGWNKVTRRFQRAISQVPITQIAVDDLKTGEIFKVDTADGEQLFYPEYEDLGDGKELIADVGYIARLRNPFKVNRTLTICNGIHSRGVFGAVRCLTDASVREENERYLADRFPDGEFAILLRVPVVTNETLSPDLQNPDSRFYEWAPKPGCSAVTQVRQQRRSSARLTPTVHGCLSVARATGEVDEWTSGCRHRAGLRPASFLQPVIKLTAAWVLCWSSCAASRPRSSRWPSGWPGPPGQRA